MTSSLTPNTDTISPKPVIIVAILWVALVMAVHFFMLQVVYPNTGGWADIYVPAKSGGHSYFTDAGEFQTISYIAIGVAVALAAATLFAVSRGKRLQIKVMLASFFLTAAGLYGATILGNGFHEWLGGAWSAAGIAIPLLIALGGQIYLFKTMKAVLTTGVRKG